MLRSENQQLRAENDLLRVTLNGECARCGRYDLICCVMRNVYTYTVGRLDYLWRAYVEVSRERDYLLQRVRDLENQLAPGQAALL
jgi:hypothetical protein